MSFELQNTQDSQLDLPITPKAFKFRSFVKIVNVPSTNNGADKLLFAFNSNTYDHSTRHEVKVTGKTKTDIFPNAKFNVF